MERAKEKMENRLQKVKKVVSKRVDSSNLNPGDHVYAYRSGGIYSHHGIYVGEGYVIHFMSNKISKSDSSPAETPCPKCGYQRNVDLGVVRTCVPCFLTRGSLAGHSLHLYEYGESSRFKKLKVRGTCTEVASCLPAPEVVAKAISLWEGKSFGEYNLIKNNCEAFAIYCKTGKRLSEQASFFMKIPLIGQAARKVAKGRNCNDD